MNEPQHEVTTILPGSRGVPTVVVREPGWQQQAAAERETQRRAEVDAEVKRIEREAAIRKITPPTPLIPADPVERMHADWEREKWFRDCEESRRVPERLAELEEWARKAELQRMMEPPPPPPPTRYGRPVSKAQQMNEQAQLDEFLRRC